MRFAVTDPKKFDMDQIKKAIAKEDSSWEVGEKPLEQPKEGKKPKKG